MITFLSKFLPLFLYPTGLITMLMLFSLLFWKKDRLSKVFLVLAFAILLFAGNKYVAMSFTRTLEWEFPPLPQGTTADVIVVLGGGTEPEISPRSMVEVNAAADRVLFGAKLFKEKAAPVILFSGGDIDFLDESSSTPANDMAILAGMMGIPQEAMIVQDQSKNTFEDAKFSCAKIKEKGYEEVILVTSAMHMPRSVALFSSQWCEVIPAPTDYSVTDASWERLWHPNLESFFLNLLPSYTHLSAVTKTLKEYFGIWYYDLRGIL